MENCFTYFKQQPKVKTLPERFTFPFFYTPNPLAEQAASELKEKITNQTEWEHNFGLTTEEGTGKMFGVLVVLNENKELGYLSAFSGNLAGKNKLEGFVPPLYDSLEEHGFFKIGESELNQLTAQIKELSESEEYINCVNNLTQIKLQQEQAIEESKQHLKQQKKKRKIRRTEGSENLDKEQYEKLVMELSRESQMEKIRHKHLSEEWSAKVGVAQEAVNEFSYKLEELKTLRKTKSAGLQQQIFDQYQFLDANGNTKSLCSIFDETNGGIVPPAGAGDCAAPKLLQYAYQHNLTPIVMAEFWWGASPKTEVRHHNHYYPSCRGKCEPILGHMLKGLKVDDNPMLQPTEENLHIEVIYEDEWMVAINKPSGLLSVPGKNDLPSAYDQVKAMYPDAEGPLLVHRLDMATSGLLLVAKNMEVHHKLQEQFMNRSIKKRYVALLDGQLAASEGLIDLPLRHNIDDRPRQLVCFEHGKRAITRWEKVEEKNGQTRVHFYPVTGRSHQLRVHAAFVDGLNAPIIGDNLYGTAVDRLCLHAERVIFQHPITKQKKTIVAPVPF